MKRGIGFLVLWLLGVATFGGVFVQVIPPGGVSWPYYIVMASTPFGALLYARYGDRASAVICYGLLAGFIFAWPLFDDELGMMFGVTRPESVALKIGLCTLLMPVVCAVAFMAGRRLLRRVEKSQTP